MKKLIHIIPFYFLTLNYILGQFIVKDTNLEATGLSNLGLVVGYEAQAGPYFIWNPDANTTIEIGGLAPGNGIGGQAAFSDDGNFLCGTSNGSLGPELSIYDQSTEEWTALGSLGFVVDGTYSGGYGISGDGKTVVGLSWADPTASGFAYAHGMAWNQTEGIMDLGSLFADMGRSTRANAVSADGSVVVGWQDFNGPWKSAVWRKNPAGGYFPNEYLLVDPAGNPNDEFNQLGECSAVSADGEWIGGYGDYANADQPWIWSEASGLVNLGNLPNTGRGFVTDISANGSVVVGWFNGLFFGDPQTAFIWTSAGGLQNLNTFVNNDWGLPTGPYKLYAATCMSSNGKYIAGYGVDTTNFSFITYRVSSTLSSVSNQSKQTLDVSVYPNPFATQTTLDFSEVQVNTTVEITDVLGKVIKTINMNGKQLTFEKGELTEGIYFLRITDKNKRVAVRVVVVQ